MKTDPLKPDVRTRICKHMNNDHQEALLEYAKRFGGISNPSHAKMIDINTIGLKLEVDCQVIEIPFDHTLEDSLDAHKTLVAMLKD